MGKKYYLGLDVGGTNLAAGIVDTKYKLCYKESMPVNAHGSIDEITNAMAYISNLVIEKMKLSYDQISSWGIGMPSCVNPKSRLLVHANCFGWHNVPIYQYLEKKLPLPIYIGNDANCAAYGEQIAGAARGYANVVVITLGTGVGGGIIIDNKIFTGVDGMGAELGHTKLVFNGRQCTCGQKGCLEAYCSATALVGICKESLANDQSSIIIRLCEGDLDRLNAKIIFDAALEQDPLARKLVNDYTAQLAAGLSSFVTIFRPEIIVVGGGVANAGDSLFQPLNRELRECTFGAAEIGVPPIIPAALGNDAGIIGAALLEKMKTAAMTTETT
jgi:glucokinase